METAVDKSSPKTLLFSYLLASRCGQKLVEKTFEKDLSFRTFMIFRNFQNTILSRMSGVCCVEWPGSPTRTPDF